MNSASIPDTATDVSASSGMATPNSDFESASASTTIENASLTAVSPGPPELFNFDPSSSIQPQQEFPSNAHSMFHGHVEPMSARELKLKFRAIEEQLAQQDDRIVHLSARCLLTRALYAEAGELLTTMRRVDEKVKSQASTIEKMKADSTAQSLIIKELKARDDARDAVLAKLKNENAAQDSVIGQMQASNTSQAGLIEQLKTENSALQDKVETLSQIQKLHTTTSAAQQGNISALDSFVRHKLDQVDSKVTSMRKDLDGTEAEFLFLRAGRLVGRFTGLRTMFDENAKATETLNAAMMTMEEKVSGAMKDILVLSKKQQISQQTQIGLANSVTTPATPVEELQTTVATIKSELGGMVDRFAPIALTYELAELQQRLASGEQSVGDLTHRVTKIEETQVDLDSLPKRLGIDTLKTDNTDIKGRVGCMEGELRSTKHDVRGLSKTSMLLDLGTSKAINDSYPTMVNKLNFEINQLRTEDLVHQYIGGEPEVIDNVPIGLMTNTQKLKELGVEPPINQDYPGMADMQGSETNSLRSGNLLQESPKETIGNADEEIMAKGDTSFSSCISCQKKLDGRQFFCPGGCNVDSEISELEPKDNVADPLSNDLTIRHANERDAYFASFEKSSSCGKCGGQHDTDWECKAVKAGPIRFHRTGEKYAKKSKKRAT